MIGNSQTSLGGVLAPAASSVIINSELLGTPRGHSATSDAPTQLFTELLEAHLGAFRPDGKPDTAAPGITSGHQQSVLANDVKNAGEQTKPSIEGLQVSSAVASGAPAAVLAKESSASAVRSAEKFDIATNLLLRVAPGELTLVSNKSPNAGEDFAVSTDMSFTEQNVDHSGSHQLEVAQSLMLRVDSGTIRDLRPEHEPSANGPLLAVPAGPDRVIDNSLSMSPDKESSLREGFPNPGMDRPTAGSETAELEAPPAIGPMSGMATELTALASAPRQDTAPRQDLVRPLDSARPQNFEPALVQGNGTSFVAEAVVPPSAGSRNDLATAKLPEISTDETLPIRTVTVSPSVTGETELLPAPVPSQGTIPILKPAPVAATVPAPNIIIAPQVLTESVATTESGETPVAVSVTHASAPQLITGDALEAAPAAATNTPRTTPTYPALHRQLIGPITTLVTETNGEKTISINVAPENLGPVTVKAHLGTDGLRLDVTAPTEAGREALRAMLPELRKELAATGGGQLNLASGDQPAQQQQHSGAQTQNPWGSRTPERLASHYAGASGQPAPQTEPPAQTGLTGSAQLDVIA